MSRGRQINLLRRLRRSVIALSIETPQPLLYHVPKSLYLSVVGLLAVLVCTASTRAAYLYRADVQSLKDRIVSVQRLNSESTQARAAALIAYQQRPRVAQDKVPVERRQDSGLTPKVVLRAREVVAAPVQPEKRRSSVVISRSEVEVSVPQNIAEALQRLRQGRDDSTLRWVAKRAQDLTGSIAWQHYRQLAAASNSAEQHYQLGVLYGAIGLQSKSLQWLTSSLALDEQARYLRAYAIAIDRQGLRENAVAAYRRYLDNPQAQDQSQILARISRLQNP